MYILPFTAFPVAVRDSHKAEKEDEKMLAETMYTMAEETPENMVILLDLNIKILQISKKIYTYI